jgi:ribonucleotide monophosphatase NagD (HAD superfamily)
VSFLDSLDGKYGLILCDVWGVVHDGVSLYPGALDRLRQWRRDGRCVVLITNAPRTADAVEAQLERIGLPRDAYDFVETGGEAGISGLLALGHPVGFIGTSDDRKVL